MNVSLLRSWIFKSQTPTINISCLQHEEQGLRRFEVRRYDGRVMTHRLKRMRRKPSHPGELLREKTLPAAGLSPSELAARLGVSNRGINDLLRERRAVNPDLAHRLARVFNTSREFWLRLQEAVDIWDAWQANRREYDRLKPLRERGV